MIEAKIVLDSVNPSGCRLTTWLLTYPRFIHAEFMTHRVFSRNAASSRAIPIEKQIQTVADTPATFEWWGKNQKGMAAMEELTGEPLRFAKAIWDEASDSAINHAHAMQRTGAHKQMVNRALEPYTHITVLATATDHRNFFKLRAHPAAQPEFQVLAYRMLDAYLKSEPGRIEYGGWHMPGFLDGDTGDYLEIPDRLKITTALACRASYSAFEDGITFEDAQRIHDTGARNGHWSPFEHCAEAVKPGTNYPMSNFDQGGVASGWKQYRKGFPAEDGRVVDLQEIMASKPDWITL